MRIGQRWPEDGMRKWEVIFCRALNPRVINLTNIFDTIDDPLFSDFCHVGPLGNKIIAEKIFKEIVPMIKKWDKERVELAERN